jgi:nifR3 family TIM-barrel protein
MSPWQKLKSKNKPILALAPMEDVTDTVFRQIVLECGRPDIFFTEFTNCEGLQSVGRSRVIHRLEYTEKERPLIAQIWGTTPEKYKETARQIVEMGFDGVDINMGCPIKKVIKNGACSALIKTPDLAKQIFEAVKEGVEGKIPVSIKTRIGFNQIQTEEWIGFLLKECGPEVLTVHGRTVKEESNHPVHWEEIEKVVEMKNKFSPNTLIVANGDLFTLEETLEKVKKYNLDGAMIGRGIFRNPWFFNPKINPETVTKKERLELLLKHTKLFEQTWGKRKDFHILKRFFKIYINSFPGAVELRAEIMQTNNYEEVEKLIEPELNKS